ncbi:MAG UNVERIFIED_CONTAM: rod shape-determining protein MreD [Rickettsiaceae bacterium]|jgi:rod shape-determining protein MreD
MGRSFSFAIVLLMFAALFNSSVIPHVRIQGGGADVVLVIISIWSGRDNAPREHHLGVCWGMLQDLLSLYPLGSTSLAYIIMAFSLDRLTNAVRLPDWLRMFMSVVATTLLKELTLIAVGVLIGFATQLNRAFISMLMVTLI